MHCFSHVFNVFALSSQFFILHFFWSSRPPHLSSGADGGGADGGSASHKPQVFLHCSFSAAEYLFLHLFFLHLLCVSAHGGELGDGSEGGGGEGATTTRTDTVGRSTLSTVTPAARDRKAGTLARACTEATTLAASPTT